MSKGKKSLLNRREMHDVERERDEGGYHHHGEFRRRSLELKGKTWNGERTSLNRNKVETYTIKPIDPLYILNPPQNLRSPDRGAVSQGQREACATWINGLFES